MSVPRRQCSCFEDAVGPVDEMATVQRLSDVRRWLECRLYGASHTKF